MTNLWNAAFANLHYAFNQLPHPQQWQNFQDWPTCHYLNTLLPQALRNDNGQPIQLVAQDATLPYPELYYEQRIFQYGMVATRANWHDFFNALIWSQFPQAKISINALHAADIQNHGLKRTAQRDALTIFDESGLILVASRRDLLELVQGFNWLPLFVHERAAWHNTITGFVFGHALFEKLLQPFIGLTAHALLVEVPEKFFALAFNQQQAYLDKLLANTLRAGTLVSPKALNPVPILGIPHWWPEQLIDFYHNQSYFRPRSGVRCCDIIQCGII